jgi:ABC-2 type transport system permease protein
VTGTDAPRPGTEAGRTTRLVIGRELRESFRRRAVWIAIVLLLIGSTAVVVLPEIIGGGSNHETVALVGSDEQRGSVSASLRAAAQGADVDLELIDAPDRAAATMLVDDGDADLAIVLSTSPPVIVTDDAGSIAVAVARQAVATSSLLGSLEQAGLTEAQAGDALTASAAVVDERNPDQGGRRAAAVVMSIVLYVLLLMLMMSVANGVAIEKANRVSEVLLAIVPARSLLFGKVIGTAIVGLATLVAGAVPVVVKIALGGSVPAGTPAALAGGAVWFALGIALYLTTAGALGALVDRQEEVGSAVSPLMAVLIVSYLVGQSAPDSTVGAVLAYIPFTSPMVMPERIALGAASPMEIVASVAIGLVTVVVVARLASSIYRRAIVRTGSRTHLRELLGSGAA